MSNNFRNLFYVMFNVFTLYFRKIWIQSPKSAGKFIKWMENFKMWLQALYFGLYNPQIWSVIWTVLCYMSVSQVHNLSILQSSILTEIIWHWIPVFPIQTLHSAQCLHCRKYGEKALKGWWSNRAKWLSIFWLNCCFKSK